ncbi:MAG TPA: glycosyltransferase [Phenylobacterium sp.]|jgi:hypothetical protein
MKVAFFGYAWNNALQPDAYMVETFKSLAAAGADVDVYLGNHLSKEYGIYGLNEQMPLDKLQHLLSLEAYDAAISFNSSMLLPGLMEAIPGRIVTVLVDEPEHLFDYLHQGPYEVLRKDIEIVAMSSAVEAKIVGSVEGAAARLHFMLPATHVDLGARSTKAAYPISWVASFVGDANLDQYLKLIAERPDFYALTRKCLALIERDGDLREIKAQGGADAALLATLPWSFDYFQSQMQNILTNRTRVEVVERLAPHGLALFGNAGWQKVMTHNAAALQAFQPGTPPASHADLRRVYNASKISINVPQSHTAKGAVQYRVIDVMASTALLVTRRDETSDLYRVFGADCPVPTFEDFDELEQLCAHYLSHESERRNLVARCNALLSEGYTFHERAMELLRIAGLEPRRGASPGAIRRIDLRLLPKI